MSWNTSWATPRNSEQMPSKSNRQIWVQILSRDYFYHSSRYKLAVQLCPFRSSLEG
jgi:hypothetical protein